MDLLQILDQACANAGRDNTGLKEIVYRVKKTRSVLPDPPNVSLVQPTPHPHQDQLLVIVTLVSSCPTGKCASPVQNNSTAQQLAGRFVYCVHQTATRPQDLLFVPAILAGSST